MRYDYLASYSHQAQRTQPLPQGCRPLQSRINRLTFEGKDAKNAFVHSARPFAPQEPLQSFNPQREFRHG